MKPLSGGAALLRRRGVRELACLPVECEGSLLVAGRHPDDIGGVFRIVGNRRVEGMVFDWLTLLPTAWYQAHQLFEDFFAERTQWRPTQRRSRVGAGGAA